MSANVEREVLQALLDEGEVPGVEELVAYVASRGWSLKRVSKLADDGRHMIGVRVAPKELFRVYTEFDPSSANLPRSRHGQTSIPPVLDDISNGRRTPRFLPGEVIETGENTKVYWIYALVASGVAGDACYVGQTVRVLRRFREHQLRPRQGRGSSELFEWAVGHKTDVRVVILDVLKSDDPARNAARRASVLEGKWLWLAQAAGIETPKSENWGRLPTPSTVGDQVWPTDEIDEIARPLAEVFQERPHISTLCLHHVRGKLVGAW